MTKEYDFGFTTVDEEELNKSRTNMESLQQENEFLESELRSHKKSLEEVRDMITPLINNLMMNPEKDYIHWPNRKEKLKQFLDKLNTHFE